MNLIKLEDVKRDQIVFKSNLIEIKRSDFKSEEQKNAKQNTEMLYNARDKVVKLFDDYSTIALEAKYKTIHGERIKKLIPKQMLQRIPIAFAYVKADNTSENLLNENEITKKCITI